MLQSRITFVAIALFIAAALGIGASTQRSDPRVIEFQHNVAILADGSLRDENDLLEIARFTCLDEICATDYRYKNSGVIAHYDRNEVSRPLGSRAVAAYDCSPKWDFTPPLCL